MAINFPASSASPWTNPDTGVTYTWDDNRKAWEANAISVPADNKYVEVIGDTMTGPLIVQDNITLTGKVTSAATQAGDIATICTTKGYVDDAITASEGAETGRLDGRYVQVAGDNMTGNLTIATDKVQLNTNGSAEFAGELYAGSDGNDPSATQNGSRIGSGGIKVSSASNPSSDGRIFRGFSTADNKESVTIRANGSAEFAGSVTVGPTWGVDKTIWLRQDTATQLLIRNDNSSYPTIALYKDGSSAGNRNVELYSDGSAVFTNDVTTDRRFIAKGRGADTNVGFALFEAGVGLGPALSTGGLARDIEFYTGNGSSPVLHTTFKADGSAVFAGAVKSANPTSTGDSTGVNIDGPFGEVAVFKGTGSSDYGFRVYNQLSNTNTVEINSDGSAEFADGDITFDSDGSANFAGAGFEINATSTAKNATVRQEYSSGAGTKIYEFWNPVRSNAVPRISFDADGSAVFAGNIVSGNGLTGGDARGAELTSNGGLRIYPDNQQNIIVVYPEGNTGNKLMLLDAVGNLRCSGNIEANQNIARSVLIKTEPDNDANYTTTTDSEGVETRVYNGPTLDVKDRLTKTQAALTALKAAAEDNATDLAGLKAAIVAALANI